MYHLHCAECSAFLLATPDAALARGLHYCAEHEPSVENGSLHFYIDATDAAVALAEEHDLDLASVTGTGENGRILKSDVEKYLKETAS